MSAFSTVSVRVQPEIADVLKKVSATHRESQGVIIERLIKHFDSLTDEAQLRVLKGVKQDFFKLLGKSLELYAWGDHAFRKGWVVWSIETYSRLDKEADGIPGIQRVARFKLGSSWMDLAMQLRARALREAKTPSEWNALYKGAIDALTFSIGFHLAFNKSLAEEGDPLHPSVLYNQACGWSLIALYTVERNGGPDSEPAVQARKRLGDDEQDGPELEWIEEADAPAVEVDGSTRFAAMQANRCLNEINTQDTRTKTGVPISEVHWLIEYANTDSDLAFVRSKMRKDFQEIIKRKVMEVSILDSFYKLRERIPDDVRELVPSVVDAKTE